MRKVRDTSKSLSSTLDAELKALEERSRQLRERRLKQLGELIAATGADALDADLLAGGLLAIVDATGTDAKEGWRTRGAAFFRERTRKARVGTRRDNGGAAAADDGAEQA